MSRKKSETPISDALRTVYYFDSPDTQGQAVDIDDCREIERKYNIERAIVRVYREHSPHCDYAYIRRKARRATR